MLLFKFVLICFIYHRSIGIKLGALCDKYFLSLDQYSWWFDAICANDTNTAKSALEEDCQEQLINGCFTSEDDSILIECPASVAACHGSFDILKLMMEHSSSVNFINQCGDNVIHCMIQLSVNNPEDEVEYVVGYC